MAFFPTEKYMSTGYKRFSNEYLMETGKYVKTSTFVKQFSVSC